MVHIRVLGPFSVTRAGAGVEVARPRCRALLAFLVSRYPAGASMDTLCDRLWPGTEAEKARNSARVHMSHLRAALRPDQPIPAKGDYRLVIARTDLDVTRFEDAAARGREFSAGGDPEHAIREFEIALAEWRGEPYESFAEFDAFEGERTRLGELLLDVYEGYATALLDHDCADEVVRLLPPIVESNPMREDVAACLMVALFRVGRQQQALAVYAHVKHQLADELGIEPGPRLAALADRIVLAPESLLPERRESDRRRSAAPPPSRVGSRHRARDHFVGRVADRRRLDACWERARAGAPQLVLVHGPAGIGKTALVERFRRDRAEAAEIAVGYCDPDVGEAFQPFAQLVRQFLRRGGHTDTPPQLLADLAPLAPDLEGSLPTPAQPADDGAGRLRLFDAVTGLLALPSQPRILVFEDLQWARDDALALLRHLLRSARGPLMVVGTARRDHRGGDGAFGQALTAGRLAHPDLDLPLAPMTDSEIAALIDELAPATHRAEWQSSLDELVDISAGNPLRLVEVLGQLAMDPDTEIGEISTDDVTALIRRRLTMCDALTQRVLRAAAVLGRRFSLTAVAEVARCSPDEALSATDVAFDLGIIDEPGDDEFEFSQALYRNALYGGMTRSRRSRLHQLAGERLMTAIAGGSETARWADAARHLVVAAPREGARTAFDAAVRAADDASARFAHREAVEWMDAALRVAPAALTDTESDRIRLHHARAVELAGDAAVARDEYFAVADAADARGDSDTLVEAVRLASPWVAILDLPLARRFLALLERALAVLPPGDRRFGALHRAGVVAAMYYDRDIMIRYADAIRAVWLQHRRPELERFVLLNEISVTDGERVEPTITQARRALALAEAAEPERDRGLDRRRLLHELLRAGELAEFDEVLAETHGIAQETRVPIHLYYAETAIATRQLTISATLEVEQQIETAGAVGRRLAIPDIAGQQMLHFFVLRLQQGRIRETIGGIRSQDAGPPQVLAGTSLLALALAMAGRRDEARVILDHVVDDDVHLRIDNFRIGGLALFAGVAAMCGTTMQRRALGRALGPFANQLIVFGTLGAVVGPGHLWLGALAAADADHSAAHDHFTAAAEFCYKADVPFWHRRAVDLREGRWPVAGGIGARAPRGETPQ